ncbi:hypothetical protein NDU88_005426 [Pleurodeles waltl]|uniref:Uncharacterized protein n=1 Tax=Pleurodeles waltl TaxID=8319 RepID=A0AAV7MJC8_PLEWA|nr:hypothetical protein NDU88_005426 [Pleurodeles waltl]
MRADLGCSGGPGGCRAGLVSAPEGGPLLLCSSRSRYQELRPGGGLVGNLHSALYSSPCGAHLVGCVGPRVPEGVQASYCAECWPLCFNLPVSGRILDGLLLLRGYWSAVVRRPGSDWGLAVGTWRDLSGGGTRAAWPWGGGGFATQDC